jgi:hypothetical protein
VRLAATPLVETYLQNYGVSPMRRRKNRADRYPLALCSGASSRKGVQVQVLSSAFLAFLQGKDLRRLVVIRCPLFEILLIRQRRSSVIRIPLPTSMFMGRFKVRLPPLVAGASSVARAWLAMMAGNSA